MTNVDPSSVQSPAAAAGLARSNRVRGVYSGKDGAAAIRFAVDEIDDHYDRLEFLRGWIEGDTSEWPEFVPDILPPDPWWMRFVPSQWRR